MIFYISNDRKFFFVFNFKVFISWKMFRGFWKIRKGFVKKYGYFIRGMKFNMVVYNL